MHNPVHNLLLEANAGEAQQAIARQVFGRHGTEANSLLSQTDPLAARIFGRHDPMIPRLKAGTNIVITQRADEFEVATTGVSADDGQFVLAGRMFDTHPQAFQPPSNDAERTIAMQSMLRHSPMLLRLKAGSNVTITQRADEFEIAASGGSGDSDQFVLPGLMFQNHSPNPSVLHTLRILGMLMFSDPTAFIRSISAGRLNIEGTDIRIGEANPGDTQIASTNNDALPQTDAVSDLGTAALRFRNIPLSGLISQIKSVATVGWGCPAIYANGRATGQTARSAALATYTVGAADGTFEVSGNVLVTSSTLHSFSLNCDYTDESNTARTLVMPMAQLAGTFVATGLITNGTGAGPYESAVMTIRCKASTTITIRPSAGTFTTVTYNAEGMIKQVA